jgi:hypothetical protein
VLDVHCEISLLSSLLRLAVKVLEPRRHQDDLNLLIGVS